MDLSIYTLLERTYKYFRIIWKKYSDAALYLAIPMLTLMEGETAKVKLKEGIEEIREKINVSANQPIQKKDLFLWQWKLINKKINYEK